MRQISDHKERDCTRILQGICERATWILRRDPGRPVDKIDSQLKLLQAIALGDVMGCPIVSIRDRPALSAHLFSGEQRVHYFSSRFGAAHRRSALLSRYEAVKLPR
jgi:hypothetical protein